MRTSPYQIALLSSSLPLVTIHGLCDRLSIPGCELHGYSSYRLGEKNGPFVNHREVAELPQKLDLAVAIEPWTYRDLLVAKVGSGKELLRLPLCCGMIRGCGEIANTWARYHATMSWFDSYAETDLPLVIMGTLDLRGAKN